MIAELTRWESFYVIVGSSAAALTGLQFVVMTLIAESPRATRSMQSVSAFGTPTVVHFCSVLLVAAIISAPWSSVSGATWAITALGVAGILYGVITILRAQGQEEYRPVVSDWVWHIVLPMIAYTAILIAGISILGSLVISLFVIGGAVLLLLFIGIHNSWDTVTYIAVVHPSGQSGSQPREETPPRKTPG